MSGSRRWLGPAVVLGCVLPLAAALAQAPAGALPPAGDAGETMTLIELLNKGGPLMYPLYLCSILMVAFGIERAISLRRARILPPATVTRLRELSRTGGSAINPAALRAELEAEDSPIARIVVTGLQKAGRTVPEIEKAIEDAGAREMALMRRNCRVLSVVASISPLLGLLGTVFGMISAFMTVAAHEQALGRTEMLAGGIYQALITTAVGLSVAIPALVLYHVFIEKVERMVTEMDDLTRDLVEQLASRP